MCNIWRTRCDANYRSHSTKTNQSIWQSEEGFRRGAACFRVWMLWWKSVTLQSLNVMLAYCSQVIRDFQRAHPHFEAAILRYFNVIGSDPQGRIGEAPRPELRSMVIHASARSDSDLQHEVDLRILAPERAGAYFGCMLRCRKWYQEGVENTWNKLPDVRWHMRARLHPCSRSCGRTCERA